MRIAIAVVVLCVTACMLDTSPTQSGFTANDEGDEDGGTPQRDAGNMPVAGRIGALAGSGGTGGIDMADSGTSEPTSVVVPVAGMSAPVAGNGGPSLPMAGAASVPVGGAGGMTSAAGSGGSSGTASAGTGGSVAPNTPPVITFTDVYVNGMIVAGTVRIRAAALDDKGVASMVLTIAPVGGAETVIASRNGSSVSANLDTRAVANGTYVIAAYATDTESVTARVAKTLTVLNIVATGGTSGGAPVAGTGSGGAGGAAGQPVAGTGGGEAGGAGGAGGAEPVAGSPASNDITF